MFSQLFLTADFFLGGERSMIINILAGGPISDLPELSGFNEQDSIWIGVDRGVLTLLSQGIEPYMAFGDFDSVTVEELAFINEKINTVRTFKPEKDEPDMELALNWAIQQKPEKIQLFGGTGGRLDHFFANVQLLLQTTVDQTPIVMINRQNVMFVKRPGEYQLQKLKEKKYISFIPISSSVENLTLKGFKYPLSNRHIPQHSTLCISNELIDDYGNFSFTEGILLVIRSSD